MSRIIRLINRAPLAWILALAFVLRIANLGTEALWYDEAFTAWLTRLDLPSMFKAIAGDNHPPLFYLIEWINVRILGSGEFALRLPSALLGVVAVWLVYKVARQSHAPASMARLAALFAAVLPAALYYGQEARMYNLMAVGVLIAVWGALRAGFVGYTLMTIGGVVAVYSQNLAIFYLAALAIILVWGHRKSPLVLFAGPAQAFFAIFIFWSPWGSTFFGQVGNVNAAFWLHPLTSQGLLMPLASMTLGWRIGDALQIPVYGAAIAMTLHGVLLWRRYRMFWMSSLLIVGVTFGAPLLVGLVSVLWRSIYLPRAFLPSSYLLMIIWAYGMWQVFRPERRYIQLVIVPALVIGLIAHYIPGTSGRTDARGWVQPVEAQWRDGDAIYYTAIHTAVWLGYYVGDLPYALKPGSGDLNQSLTDQTRAAMDLNQEEFEVFAKEHRRAWLLTYTNPMTRRDEHDEIAHILASYPSQLIARKQATNAEMSIYLVQLKESQ